MKNFYKQIYTVLIFLCAGCVQSSSGNPMPVATERSTKAQVEPIKFCDLFEQHEKQEKMELKGRFKGCPMWTESVTKINADQHKGSISVNQLATMSKELETQAQTEAKLAYIAQRSGFLQQPHIQKKLVRLVGNLYMREKKLMPNITESEKRAYYEANKDQFNYPTVRFARHVLFDINDKQSEAKAKQLAQAFYETHRLKQMTSGEFAKYAATMSKDRSTSWQGGLLPATAPSGKYMTLEAPMAKALFELERGQISRPIKSSKGWHVLYFARPVKGYSTRYEDVASLVHMKLQKKKYNKFIDFQLKSLEPLKQ